MIVRRAALVALLLPAASSAEPTRNIDLTLFDPTPSTTGTSFHLQTADVGARGDVVATLLATYASNPLVLGTVQNDDHVVRHQTMVSVGGAYAFLDRFEAGARMPLYLQSGDTVQAGMFGVPPASGAAAGDLTLHGKMQLSRSDKLSLGTGLSLTVPTASDSSFTGTDMPAARLMLLASYTASSELSFHVNAGGVLRKKASFANIEQGSGAAWAARFTLRIAHPLFIDVEAFGDIIPGGYHTEPTLDQPMGSTSMLATVEGLAGLRYQATQQLSLGIGGGRGLTSGIGSPEVRGVFTLAYSPSARALPPLHRPEPVVPVDPTTVDTDFDKIFDADDQCPEAREDKDGFEDEDGCPDPDNDGDGILDADDKCPMDAEDKDGFEDDDGCPDLDNDKDGILDADDKCPNEAEKINGNDDDDGCPDKGDSLVISLPERLELLEPVEFNGAELARSSANQLAQLAATLRARADILRIRITVHVQPSKSAQKDQQLSDSRANAMKGRLVKAGIAEERIEVKGFGSTKPLVPAKQKGAAQMNARVELIILERK